MTIDARRAGLEVAEVELDLRHRATGRDLGGFLHRGRQLRDLAARVRAAAASTSAACGCRSSAGSSASGPSGGRGRGIGLRRRPLERPGARLPRAPPRGRTTGVLKLVGIPLVGLLATRRAVRRAARRPRGERAQPARHAPGPRAEGVPRSPRRSCARRSGRRPAAPYDLREMAMLGDAGSNALGALLGLSSVNRFTGRGRWVAIGALAGLTLLGERRSLGALIERTPGAA